MGKQHRLIVHVRDVCGEDTSLHVCITGSQQNIIRVPIDGKDGGPGRFLEEFRDPPVAPLVKKANLDNSDKNRSTLTRVGKTDGTVGPSEYTVRGPDVSLRFSTSEQTLRGGGAESRIH